MKEKALRDTQIRSIHEKEMRVDESPLKILRVSHDTTSQIQELQERVNCMNDSGEFQEIESDYSGKISRSQSTYLNRTETFLAILVLSSIHSFYESKCHRFDSSAGKHRAICRER